MPRPIQTHEGASVGERNPGPVLVKTGIVLQPPIVGPALAPRSLDASCGIRSGKKRGIDRRIGRRAI